MKTPIAAGTDIAGRNTPNIWPKYAQAVHCSALSICHSASQMPKETAKYATHHLNAVGGFQRGKTYMKSATRILFTAGLAAILLFGGMTGARAAVINWTVAGVTSGGVPDPDPIFVVQTPDPGFPIPIALDVRSSGDGLPGPDTTATAALTLASNGPGTEIPLKGGQTLKDLSIALTPAGAARRSFLQASAP
jgi:hypothetical protein